MEIEQENKKAEEPELPLISCIVPTAARPTYLARSLQYFVEQDYPNKELIVVYNHDADLPAAWLAMPWALPPNVRLVRTPARILGAKRNEGCRHARGSIIAQWDDDDLYHPGRLTAQVTPIIKGEADITGVNNFIFFEMATGIGYRPTPDLFKTVFQTDVACGTLVYSRWLWDTIAQYPNMYTAEDYNFLIRLLRRGVRLKALNGYGLFAYLRHAKNTWQFEQDNFRRYTGWLPTALPAWLLPHLPFYKAMAAAVPVSVRGNREVVALE